MLKKNLLALILVSLVACGKETERDKIGDAQLCLDKVTSANPDAADECVQKVSGINSLEADGIRCSGAFVKEGFTDATYLIDVMDSISSGFSGNNLSTFLGLIIFDGRGTLSSTNSTFYYDYAKTYSGYCARAQLKVGTLITTFSFFGNAIIKLACDAGATCGTAIFNNNGPSVLDLASMVIYLGTSPNAALQLYSDIGTLVINSHLVSCRSTDLSDTLCKEINDSVTNGGGTTSPTSVGKRFLGNILKVTLP